MKKKIKIDYVEIRTRKNDIPDYVEIRTGKNDIPDYVDLAVGEACMAIL